MTLVVSIGAAILPASMTAVGTGALAAGTTAAGVGAAGGALSGAVIGSTAAGLSGLGALAAGTVGAGALAGAGLAVNEMTKGPPKSTPNAPTLAAGLDPAMEATRANVAPAQAPLSGLGAIGQAEQKPIGMARGGQVPIKEGAYVIPADVVSALGNGSSKAGADFLQRLLQEVKVEATKRHGLGAVHDRA